MKQGSNDVETDVLQEIQNRVEPEVEINQHDDESPFVSEQIEDCPSCEQKEEEQYQESSLEEFENTCK